MNEMDFTEGSVEESCDIKTFERNKYFYGKLMTVADFETEQRYFNGKRSMLNRLIHGVGLVCGLKVEEAEIVDQKLKVKLSEGVALDCCGNEIVVEDTGVSLDVEGTPADGTNYIYLKYSECLTGRSAAMSNPSACEETCCYSRIKEGFKLEVNQQAPPVDLPLDWKEIWQQRDQDIKDLASKLGIADPLASLVAKLSVSADAYLEEVKCPSCDDPKVLLAVANITGSNVELDSVEDENLYRRCVVYSNPMLYELLRSHLTDLANPHQVTAEQTGALVSVDGVDNPGGDVDLVRNNAITIAADNANKRITIGENHSARKNNPHEVTAEQTGALVSVDGVDNPGGDVDLAAENAITIVSDNAANRITIGENHSPRQDNPHNVTAAQAGALVSVEGVTNPGGNIDLVEGDNISIEVVPEARAAIRISSTGGIGANTGIIPLTIPPATPGEQFGNTLLRGIAHGIETELSPAIILGLVTTNGIIMEDDFITQRQIFELMAKLYNVPPPPAVFFRALAVTNKTFDILAVNLNPEIAETINISWWAVPATQRIGKIDIGRIVGAVRERVGIEAVNAVAAEKNVADSEVNLVIGEMLKVVNAEPTGTTITNISSSTGTKAETIQPILDALVAEGAIKVSGTGARRRYAIQG